MTLHPATEALETYRQYPMDDGEAVLLLPEESLCLELGALDAPDDVVEQAAALIRGSRGRVAVLAIARTAPRPCPADLLVWARLSAALSDAVTELRPLQLLPAAGGRI